MDRIIAICDLFGVSADYLLRDMAAGERQETAAHPSAGKAEPKRWGFWAMAAFGAVTLFILRILASVNRTYMEPTIVQSADGGVMIARAGYYTGFGDYIEERGLQWLVWMAVISLLVGGGQILWTKYREWKEKQ